MAFQSSTMSRRKVAAMASLVLGVGAMIFLLRPDGPLGPKVWPAEAIEPHLAAQDSRLALAWMEVAGAGEVATAIAVRRSQDGGASFGTVEHLAAPGGRLSADPTLSYGQDGSLYLSWLGFRSLSSIESEPFAMAILVARARPGAATFDPPQLVADDRQTTYDKPWSTVTSDGTLHVVFRFAWANRAGFHDVQILPDGSRRTQVLVDEPGFSGALPVVCSDPLSPRWFVASLRPERGIELRSFGGRPSDPELVSLPGERVAHEGPSCVVTSGEVSVSYGVSDGVWDSARSPLLQRIVVARRSEPDGALSRRYIEAPGQLMMHPQLVATEPDARQPGATMVRLAYLSGRRENDPEATLRLLTLTGGSESPQILRSGLQLVAHREDRRWSGDYLGAAMSGHRTAVAVIDNRSRRRAEIVFAPR